VTCVLRKADSFKKVIESGVPRPSRNETSRGWNLNELDEEAKKLSTICDADGINIPVSLEASSDAAFDDLSADFEGNSTAADASLHMNSQHVNVITSAFVRNLHRVWNLNRISRGFNAENVP